ncbi:MAG: hypothetical protein ACKOTB_15080, partial [Planctomycetia bacterium]
MKDVQSLWELFLAGGFLMWPIVAMSVVVVGFGLERLWALRRGRFVPRGLVDGLHLIILDARLHAGVHGSDHEAVLHVLDRPHDHL